MRNSLLYGVLLFIGILVLACGCFEPPIRDPAISVTDIGLADVSFRTLTVNTTVLISNPNPVGATLNKVAFDVYFLDGGENYLGHGERGGFDVKENGNTTVVVPVQVGTLPAIGAVASLVRDGSLTLKVNGSAFIDIKVTSFEKRFEEKKEFRYEDFAPFLPVSSPPVTGADVTGGLSQILGMPDGLPAE